MGERVLSDDRLPHLGYARRFFVSASTSMTRYTNVGRKRTHLDAGFSGDKQDVEDEPAVAEPAEQPQPAKKRKHTKHKQPTEGEKTPAVVPIEREQKAEDSEVRNAYMNRDENRKSACKLGLMLYSKITRTFFIGFL